MDLAPVAHRADSRGSGLLHPRGFRQRHRLRCQLAVREPRSVNGHDRLLRALDAPPFEFAEARTVAIVGLTMGRLLKPVGFLVIAGEWFAMWQSQTWNGQRAAGIIGLALLHLCGPEPEWRP